MPVVEQQRTTQNLTAREAWEAWEPTPAEPWNERRAAHLFRRACFGATSEQLREAVAGSPAQCVDQLFTAGSEKNRALQTFKTEMTTMATGLAGGEPQQLEAWWLYRMLFTPAPLLECMTLFWHGHFATSAATVNSAALMLAQNATLRKHALGSFPSMVQAVSRDAAMLTYLNSTTNARLHPNENYARELMELFCLGPGNYTERDIQETARCFTGWEIRNRRFRFNAFQHDDGVKTIFDRTGNFDGDDAVRVILSQAAAPRFVARKLIRYFCTDHPVGKDLVEPLAQELRDNGFAIAPVVRRILSSRFFYSSASVGQKLRSPVALAVGLLRSLDGTIGMHALAAALRPLGQRLFYPPNVKGWDGGGDWINATTPIGRVNLVAKIVRHGSARFGAGGGGLSDYVESLFADSEVESPAEFVDTLSTLLLAAPLPTAARQELVALARDDQAESSRAERILLALAVLPEFQLG